MKNQQFLIIALGILTLLTWGTGARGESSKPIGSVTAVQREANVTHEGRLDVALVKLGESVLFKDFYETKTQAKLKLLFDDDSILSLGENTKLQIAENIYDPAKSQRSTVVNMVNGSVRALVGKVFGGAGSKFEIHTPTAAAAARGTYFIVWTTKEGGHDPTGVVNIGESGKVVVSNINPAIQGSIELGKNQYTLVEENQPPIPATKIDAGLLSNLLASTEVKEQAHQEVPKGMEAPGSDVSGEVSTPPPLGGAAVSEKTTGGETPAVESPFQEAGSPTEVTYPSLPPIQQQPSSPPPQGGGSGSSPVTVDVNFP
jgi:hypothetical protein